MSIQDSVTGVEEEARALVQKVRDVYDAHGLEQPDYVDVQVTHNGKTDFVDVQVQVGALHRVN